MKIEIIKNPSTDVFLDLVRTSKEQLLASPFIKAKVAEMILDNRQSGAKTCLLTSYKLNSFYRNSSDLAALESFVQNQIDVRNYARLHANGLHNAHPRRQTCRGEEDSGTSPLKRHLSRLL